ncbi:hypothetical protein GQ43DRAFT_497085, partial [Delitschia confertaspora ATCC 74209]
DLSVIPLAPNPSGAPPNFVNLESLAPTTYGVMITMIILSFVFVTMRIYTDVKRYRKLALDDSGRIFTNIHGICIMSMNETARHAWDVPLSAVDSLWLKKNAVVCMVYSPAMWCAKTCYLYALYPPIRHYKLGAIFLYFHYRLFGSRLLEYSSSVRHLQLPAWA